MNKRQIKNFSKNTWHFIWVSDSLLSWIVNIILAFVLIKFIVYPGLGLLFGTNYPVVAVVSGSMEHDGSFDDWWDQMGEFYTERDITKEEFRKFSFKNGFNTGDIMVLIGTDSQKIKIGNVIVFTTNTRPDPIIHRVINVAIDENNNKIYFTTKGDHNLDIYHGIGEDKISTDRYIGKAILRIPYLGWIKIEAVKFKNTAVNLFTNNG